MSRLDFFDSLDVTDRALRLYRTPQLVVPPRQRQTQDAFSTKWETYDYESDSYASSLNRQKSWYLDLYGFDSEEALARHLQACPVILDAGAGTCGKAAWFARLSPESEVIAADISTSLKPAAEHFRDLKNLHFVQCDIGSLGWLDDSTVDYVSCDQVIHHTAEPRRTFYELTRVLRPGRDVACYVYRKKALPRELLDEHFRSYSQQLSTEQLMDLSRQLTTLGQVLPNDQELVFPSIPALGIEGGTFTVQRFIYWNFIKCFWNEELGEHISNMANFDWYAPAQAQRYSEEEFRKWIQEESLETVHFHQEPACYSGRFRK